MDIVRLHERALDETARLVGGVRPDQMDLPTPCSDWDVRTLIAHLVGGNVRFLDVAEGKPAWALETTREVGHLEDEGWRVRKDGSRFWANVVIAAVRDTQGVLQGFAKVTRDLTQRRRDDLPRTRGDCGICIQAGRRRQRHQAWRRSYRGDGDARAYGRIDFVGRVRRHIRRA